MATVVTTLRDVIDSVSRRFSWADPVLLAWGLTVGAVVLGAEAFHEDYDMLVDTLRIVFYFTLFELIISIPDEQTDTPNTEQLFSLFSAVGAGGLGYSIEVAAAMVAGDMTAAQLLALGLFNSRLKANYTTTEHSLTEALFEEGPVTHPYITVLTVTAVTIPFLLKGWVYVFGKAHAPQVRSPATFVLVSATAATTGFVVYYLSSGLSWGQVTGQTRIDGAGGSEDGDDSDGDDDGQNATSRDASDPRRTESGFTFPEQGEGGAERGTEPETEHGSERENPVADHPVARQRENRGS